jgi:hypothetical protein
MVLPLLLGAGTYALVTWKAGSPEWGWIVEAFGGPGAVKEKER